MQSILLKTIGASVAVITASYAGIAILDLFGRIVAAFPS